MTVGDLKSRFENVTLRMVLECGGNGRSFFTPEARGNQWTNGGAGCAEWTGVRLRDVLQAAGLKPSAVYTGNYGADPHLSGDPEKQSLSRGVPVDKAMDEHSLLVFAMNGQPLPNIHGFPIRLLIPGWPGSASHKWLTRITVRDQVHDGQGMGGFSYRVMKTPIIPGSEADEANTRILESMPVRSIITSPANGTELPAGTRELELRGAAWDGDREIRTVQVSIDYGVTWTDAEMQPARNRYDWRRWTARVALPSEGYFEVWSKATDSEGVTQPHVAGNWNPQGYGGNPFHRIAVLVPT
jgi:sulfite oxidase